MKRGLAAALAAGALAVSAWMAAARRKPPEVPFVRAKRETLVSSVTTNGRIEPAEFAAVRSEAEGPVSALHVEAGQSVAHGAAIATIDVSQAGRDLAAANAAIAQAESDLQRLAAGGDAAARADVEAGIEKASLELQVAEREARSVERLAARNAATQAELLAARDRVAQARAAVAAGERRRNALVPEEARSVAQARLQQARVNAGLARQQLERGTLRAPIAGIAFHVAVKRGAFLHPGDLVAEIGSADRMRAILYVDEPELGRVAAGMAAVITWDGAPGSTWTAKVQQMPSRIVPLGARQVGEVVCAIETGAAALPPGANINAAIQSSRIPEALVIPKAALRRDGTRIGVLALTGDRVEWRDVALGQSSVTQVQVLSGVSDRDAVALPVDFALRSGDAVSSVFRP